MSETLKNVSAVIAWLNENGYEIGKSAVYQHRKEGKILPDKKGRFPVSTVKRYAERWLAGGAQSAVPAEVIDLQERKLEAEARKLAAQAAHWEHKTAIQQGLYIEKSAFERELAARAMILRQDLESFFRSQAAGMVATVSGDGMRTPDLIEFCLDHLERFLDRYAEPHSEWGSVDEDPDSADESADMLEESENE